MKAITWDVSVPRYLVGKALGGFTRSAVYGGLSGLRKTELTLPDLPGARWTRLRVVSCGICGTDVGNLNLEASPILSPFGSFPAVMGHEILARVEEVGPGVTTVQPGDRVAVDPVLSCEVRGFGRDDWCATCRRGLFAMCERGGDEGALQIGGHALRPGMTMGYHADLPGGWSEEVIAHESQLHRVPEALDERSAAIVEPLSIGLHAALNVPLPSRGGILVIGSGMIALGSIWALRAAGFQGEIVSQVKRKNEAELALALGASRTVKPGDEAREALVATGATGYDPLLGDEVYAGGGFPLIFDCVARKETLTQALRYASPEGRVVMLGCAARMNGLDLTLVWARSLAIQGFVGYGIESWRGARVHTFDATMRLIEETAAPVYRLVTHAFPLEQYRDALAAADDHKRSGAVHVVLEP